MKIVKIIMALAALLCACGVAYFEITQKNLGDHAVRVFCRMPENLICNLCFVGVPVFLGALIVIALVQRVREHKNGIVILGLLALICGGVLGLIYGITGGRLGYFMHEIESPDGKHSVYYVRNKYSGDVEWLRKDKGHMYYIIKNTDTTALDNIEWKDDELSLDGESFSYNVIDKK